jgi:hypothetical protein
MVKHFSIKILSHYEICNKTITKKEQGDTVQRYVGIRRMLKNMGCIIFFTTISGKAHTL